VKRVFRRVWLFAGPSLLSLVQGLTATLSRRRSLGGGARGAQCRCRDRHCAGRGLASRKLRLGVVVLKRMPKAGGV
jgi:hypothetical protein